MRGKELYLEDYVHFFNKDERALTISQLNKIVRINGFLRPSKFSKSSLEELLHTVDLTPPDRSTIGECALRTSTCAELSLAEVTKDIASLRWQECPIVSILTVGIEAATDVVEEAAQISSSYGSRRDKKKGGNGGESKGSGAKRKWKSVTALPELPVIGSMERTTGSPSSFQV